MDHATAVTRNVIIIVLKLPLVMENVDANHNSSWILTGSHVKVRGYGVNEGLRGYGVNEGLSTDLSKSKKSYIAGGGGGVGRGGGRSG